MWLSCPPQGSTTPRPGSPGAPSTLDAVALHWSLLPASSLLVTGTPLERLNRAWPSPQLVKLEVLTLELLFLLAAPHVPRREPERPPRARPGPIAVCPAMVGGGLASGALEARVKACDCPEPTSHPPLLRLVGPPPPPLERGPADFGISRGLGWSPKRLGRIRESVDLLGFDCYAGLGTFKL